jgi:hypothetical protein
MGNVIDRDAKPPVFASFHGSKRWLRFRFQFKRFAFWSPNAKGDFSVIEPMTEMMLHVFC